MVVLGFARFISLVNIDKFGLCIDGLDLINEFAHLFQSQCSYVVDKHRDGLSYNNILFFQNSIFDACSYVY